MRFLKILFGLSVASALVACGGGGGNASAPGTLGTGSGSGSGSRAPVATIDVVASAAQLNNAAGSSVLITATVKDANNNALVARAVTFAASSGNLTSVQTATGGDFGGATAVLSTGADDTSRTITVTVTSEGKTGTVAVAVSSNGVSNGAGSIAVAIFNSGNAAVTSIASGGSFTARATVRDGTGGAIVNKLVLFNLNGASIAALTPDTALTNAAGVAQVVISPSSLSAIGAATLSASTQVGTGTLTIGTDFAVSAANLTLGLLNVGSVNLPSGGNTSVDIAALINGVAAAGTPVNIAFSASCGRFNSGTASFSQVTNGSGVASVSYSAVNPDGTLCSGLVTLSASSAGGVSSSKSITVAAPAANAITFVAATPGKIFVAGSGALEQSVVEFKVLSGSTPMVNEAVIFSIQTNPGGVGLNASGSLANVTVTTDGQGIARVSVFSGTIPGPVKVRASLSANPLVYAETQNLSVSSGPPSQRFMSLAVQTYNIEGWTIDGKGTQLTVRLADRQGNPVEDGTVVNFTAEGGQVASSCATALANGISSCTVDFISQNPRPSNGRVSVLAFTAGTKDYVDVNGNNRYDAGVDTLLNIGDAYRDDNEDGVYNSSVGEFVVPRLGNALCAGAGEPFPSRVNTCDANLATTVRQQAVILFSSSQPFVTFTSALNAFGVSFKLGSLDNNLLPMPAGTTVTAEAVDGSPANAVTCSVAKVTGNPVPNVNPTTDPLADLTTSHSVFLKDCGTGDTLFINIGAPSGLITTYTLPIP